MADLDPRSGHVWYSRVGATDAGLRLLTAQAGGRHPDGTVVDDARRDDEPLVWSTHASDRGLLGIHVPEERAPQAPALWFVNVDEPRASVPSTNLVAFAVEGTDIPAGTVVSRFVFGGLGVSNDRQAGAVRWHRTGLVHQIFVSPTLRRRNVGTVLLHAADAWHQANGWPGHLHGDGRRTELGEQFLATLRHPDRFAPLSKTMPPMDPS